MSSTWTTEWRREEMKKLWLQWRDCDACTLAPDRTRIVFGNGPVTADMVFIAEAPGESEDESGETLCGQAGRLFDKLLAAAGIKRVDVFTINLVMCRPPGNRDPTKAELTACLDRLHRQVYLIDPMFIFTIGKIAMTSLLKGDWKAITEEHGKIGTLKMPGILMNQIEYPVMPLLAPGYILREDRVDRDTNTWERGGLAEATVENLVIAKKNIEFRKRQYASVQKRLRVI